MTSFRNADEDHPILRMPDVGAAAYLVAYLGEAGICMSSGMGLTPLTWQEIESWLRVTELNLSTWEKLTVRELSEAYAGEYSAASDKNRSAPYIHRDEEEEIDRKAVSDKLKSIFKGLKQKSPTQHDE